MKIVGKLEKESLLFSKKEGMVKNVYALKNDKFVNLKRAYNIYSIFTSGLLDFLRETYEEPEAIVLFGSYAKGDDISISDIDIAVVTARAIGPKLSRFEKVLGRHIKIYEITIAKAEKEFLNNLANGIVLQGYLKVIK